MSHTVKFARLAAILLLALVLISAAACSLFPDTNPTATPVATQIIAEPTYSPDIIFRNYTWSYNGRDWQWTMEIPQSLYDYYVERPRAMTQDYSIYVTHPSDDAYIDMLIEIIENFATGAGYDELETVNFTVSFIQSLPYAVDSVTTSYDEYPRYPIETLVDNGGDCEDTSILMAAILNGMGYGTVLLSLPNHMAVGVLGGDEMSGMYFTHNDGKYYYLETTGSGWEIGELPTEYREAAAYIYDIAPVPILTHDWNAESYWYNNKMGLTVTVENLGTETATDIYIYAAFDAGGDMVWNPEESQHFNLGPDQSITQTLQLSIPEGEHTRLIVQIVDNRYSVDTSYSEWFDT
jgi:predicted transglutaminase-like cysteine proteinase